MKVVLFSNGRNRLTLSTSAADYMMLWLPQRYEFNREIYNKLKIKISEAKDDIVELSDECFNTKKFRTNPSFIDTVVKWSEPDYNIIYLKDEYYDIVNFGTLNERITFPDLSHWTKGYEQSITTYYW